MKRSDEGAFSPLPPAPLPFPAHTVIAALEPIVLPDRLARIELAVRGRISSVVAVIESLADPHNAAAILRTSDGLGVGEVHAIERDARVLISDRVTKGCEKWMTLRRHATPEDCANELKRRGFAIFVADMRATRTFEEIAGNARVALAFGNEHAGVSPELRAASDGAFCVPMRGMVESFNVSVAAALALYTVTRGRNGDVGSGEAEELKARFLMESVREPELIVERWVRDQSHDRTRALAGTAVDRRSTERSGD